MVYPFWNGEKLVYVTSEEAPTIKHELDFNPKLKPLIAFKGRTWVANEIADYGIYAVEDMAALVAELLRSNKSSDASIGSIEKIVEVIQK